MASTRTVIVIGALVAAACGESVKLGGVEAAGGGAAGGGASGGTAGDAGAAGAAGVGAAGVGGAGGLAGAAPMPLAYYPFDTDSVTATELIDVVGAHSATLRGFGTPELAPGQVGEALVLDGVDDFAEADPFPEITSTFTVSLWVRLVVKPDFFGDPGFFDKWDWRPIMVDGQPVERRCFGVGISRGRLNAAVSLNGTDSFSPHATDAIDVAPKLLDQWVHVAATNDGAVVVLYRDGQPVAESTLPSQGPLFRPDPDIPVWIGRSRGDVPVSFVGGSMDELVVWDRALDAEQVSGLFALGRDGRPVVE